MFTHVLRLLKSSSQGRVQRADRAGVNARAGLVSAGLQFAACCVIEDIPAFSGHYFSRVHSKGARQVITNILPTLTLQVPLRALGAGHAPERTGHASERTGNNPPRGVAQPEIGLWLGPPA